MEQLIELLGHVHTVIWFITGLVAIVSTAVFVIRRKVLKIKIPKLHFEGFNRSGEQRAFPAPIGTITHPT